MYSSSSMLKNLLSEDITIQIRITIIKHTKSILSHQPKGYSTKWGVYNLLHQTLQNHINIWEEYFFTLCKQFKILMAAPLTSKAQRTKLQPTCLLIEHGMKMKPTTTGSDILNNYTSKLAVYIVYILREQYD